MSLPKQYQFLLNEGGPKLLVEFLKIYGVKEKTGKEDNPIIMSWAKDLDLKEYIHDSIAWCGLAMAIVAKNADKPVVINPLWAANWLKFGTKTDKAKLGYVMIFKRPGGNHVGIYVGEDKNAYHILGGNQADSVSITRILKSRCIGIRIPPYKTMEPSNVRQIFYDNSGSLSINEA